MREIPVIENGQGRTETPRMVDQTKLYAYPTYEDNAPVDFDKQGEMIHGPNWRLLQYYPHTRNIRTGAPMTNTHHCAESDHARVLGCFRLGHLGFCTVFIKVEGRWVRCGEVLGVKSDGCALHSSPAGYNKIYQWYYLQFQQKRNDLIWKWLKVHFQGDGGPEQEVAVDQKQALIEETEKDLEAKIEQPDGIHEKDYLHNRLKQTQKIAEKDRRKALAASRATKGKIGVTATVSQMSIIGQIEDTQLASTDPRSRRNDVQFAFPTTATGDGEQPLNAANGQAAASSVAGKVQNKLKELSAGHKSKAAKKGGASKAWMGTRRMQAMQNAPTDAGPEDITSHLPPMAATPQLASERPRGKLARFGFSLAKEKKKTVGGTKNKDGVA